MKYLTLLISILFLISCNNKKFDFKFESNKDLYEKSVMEILSNSQGEFELFSEKFYPDRLKNNDLVNTYLVMRNLGVTSIFKSRNCVLFYYDKDDIFNRKADVLIYNSENCTVSVEPIIHKVYDDKWSEGKIESFLY